VNVALAGAGAFALTGILVWLAPHLGLLDRPESAPERKLQRGPVPRVGGIVLALGLSALWFARLWSPAAPLAFGAAFALGLADDLAPRGLPRALKFALEAGVCALFAWETPGSAALAFGLAALALAAANTFDNADGALSALACAGLARSAPCAAAILGGFLPWNLWIRARSGAPRAYLGDAGSHLIGLVLLADPRSAPILVLPLLDLLRLSWVRWRAGSRPWIGDRRHLAHLLQARGWSPTAVAAILLALALLFALALALALG
jgi:UDP-N-acetylmuramyl pentapeptide phosphotransferase/UDP-N-acetylglucosamine-1-phosphate transferase